MSKNGSGSRCTTTGPVLVVGTGLIGTSIALALRTCNIEVWLSDPSPTTVALAGDMGAGVPLAVVDSGGVEVGGREPALVVVAAPPDVTGEVVFDSLLRYPHAVVTDVASVKGAVVLDVVALADYRTETVEEKRALLSRYVGSHPMAGRARSGASHADGDLFYGRPWVIVPTDESSHEAVLAVRNLAVDLGAVPTELEPEEHDEAVALISHVPQLVSSLLAARLQEASDDALGLVGQGLRDTTRIAASDPGLWTNIIAGNTEPVVSVLKSLQQDLDSLLDRLQGPGATREMPIPPGGAGAIAQVIAAGNRGVERIPGKHGGAPRRWGYVEVLVPDEPGELGRLFTDLGLADINIEDLRLEHSSRQPVGLARLMVEPMRVNIAAEELEARGWRIASKEIR